MGLTLVRRNEVFHIGGINDLGVKIPRHSTKLRDEEGVSILYITHDIASARYVADRLIVMYAGQIAETGPIEDVLSHPRHPYTQLLLSAVPDPRAPLSVAASRLTINQLLLDAQDRDEAAVARASVACFDSADYREGRAAFLEKRKPQFKGR